MAKATKKKAVKKAPFNRRLKSAKFKNLDKDKAISDLREVIKTSRIFLNQTKYRFETMVDQNIFTYDDLQKALHQCELVFGAYEMGIEFEKDKNSFTPEQLKKVDDEWGYDIRESSHKSVRMFLGSFHYMEQAIEKANRAISQLDEEFVADEFSKKINGKIVRIEDPDNTTIVWMYKD